MIFPLITKDVELQKRWDALIRHFNDHDKGAKQWSTVNALVFSVPAAALASGTMNNSQMQIWVDEVGNNLTFKVKYSNGTVKSGTVALV